MKEHQLEILQGGKDNDDLIVAMLRALELAEACGSKTSHDLLRMALLNEGIRIARRLEEHDDGVTGPQLIAKPSW